MGKIVLGNTPIAPGSADPGKSILTFPGNQSARVTDENGVSIEFGATPNYGKNFQFAKDQFEDTNTTAIYKTYTSIAYPAGLGLAGQKYEIQFSATTRYSSAGRNHISRVSIDGTTIEEEIQIEHKDTGADIRLPIGYTYIVDGSELNNAGGFVEYDFRSQLDGDTSRVYSATLTFKRVV